MAVVVPISVLHWPECFVLPGAIDPLWFVGVPSDVPPDLVHYCFLWHTLPVSQRCEMWWPWLVETVDLVDSYICRVRRPSTDTVFNIEGEDNSSFGFVHIQVFDEISMTALKAFLRSW